MNNNKLKKSIFEKLFFSKKDSENNKNDNNNLENTEEFDIDDYEEVEDNEQNFIVINGKKMRKKNKKVLEQPKIKKIIDDLIMADPDAYKANQQRNLDRETGGTELPETYTTSALDVWDNRVEEIAEMSEIKPQDFNSDDKASMIWDKKRKKKQQEEDHQGNQEPQKNKSKSFFSKSKNIGKSREF